MEPKKQLTSNVSRMIEYGLNSIFPSYIVNSELLSKMNNDLHLVFGKVPSSWYGNNIIYTFPSVLSTTGIASGIGQTISTLSGSSASSTSITLPTADPGATLISSGGSDNSSQILSTAGIGSPYSGQILTTTVSIPIWTDVSNWGNIPISSWGTTGHITSGTWFWPYENYDEKLIGRLRNVIINGDFT